LVEAASFPRRLWKPWWEAMRMARVRLDQYLAYLVFALSFLFLLAVVALVVSADTLIKDLPHSRPVRQPK